MHNLKQTYFALISLALLCLVLALPVGALQTATGPHIQVSLLSEDQMLVPGQRQWLAVLLEPEQEWHTYWQNPGDSGEAPTIRWQSSEKLTFGDIHWPLPEAIPVAHLVNYGYAGANLLMVPVDVPTTLNIGQQVSITADLSWLVCKEDCIPGWATLGITLPVAEQASLSEDASLFTQTRQKLPEPNRLSGLFEVTENHIVLSAAGLDAKGWQVFPLDPAVIQHNDQQQALQQGQTTHFTLARSHYFDANQTDLQFLVSDGERGYYVDASVNIASPSTSTATPAVHSTPSLWLLLLMAFAGGVILNLMPCVLPVLSIKALALQHQSPSVLNKLAYLLGVLASFNLFALAIIALRQSGEAIGWGFHMQSPWVIALLAFLFVFIALVLMDVMSVGNRLAGVGEFLVSGQSASSHFFTGVLAVVVASPCTAPFMAAAMGVAMVSPAWLTLLLFSSLAIGFALPLTLLFWSARFSTWLPKPGAWMQTFKQLLAFPMLATVIWLVWVFQAQMGEFAQVALLSALLLFAMLCWLSGKLSGYWRQLCYLSALVAILSPLLFLKPSDRSSQPSDIEGAFSEERLADLRNNNQVVLVNMTADWCITCKVNEQVAFTSAELESLLGQDNVHYLVGDWTNKNQTILAYLNQYQRAGVPLYVVYAGMKSKQVLPQILTSEIVINAIRQAQQEINHAS